MYRAHVQVLAELKELIDYRSRYMTEAPGPPPILALGLSSRKNLCVHPKVAGTCLKNCECGFKLMLLRSVAKHNCLQ